MSIESRLKKLEEVAIKKQDNKVEIYIAGETEVIIYGEDKTITRAEYEEIKKTWTDKDIIIDVAGEEYED